jgi:hypothetical protein
LGEILTGMALSGLDSLASGAQQPKAKVQRKTVKDRSA